LAVTQRRQPDLNAGPNGGRLEPSPALRNDTEAQRQSKERHLMPTTDDMKTSEGPEVRGSDDDKLASDRFDRVERRRFPALLGVGGSLAAVVVIVAFVADAGLAWPLLILFALCLAVGVVYRLVAGSNRDDADHSDSLPKQPATRSRPLGDTPEAHDEISPHDIPLYSPARRAAEQQANGVAATTRGHRQGGAAGRDGPADDERLVGPDEKNEAQI
jgi:hypothetical protein